jgi:hypothetical protein
MATFYTYNLETLYFSGTVEAETCPENASDISPWCGDWNRYSKWEGDHWNEYEVLESGEHVVVEDGARTKPVNWFELTDTYNEDGTIKTADQTPAE